MFCLKVYRVLLLLLAAIVLVACREQVVEDGSTTSVYTVELAQDATWAPDGTITFVRKIIHLPGTDQEFSEYSISSFDRVSGEISDIYTCDGWIGKPAWSATGAYLGFESNCLTGESFDGHSLGFVHVLNTQTGQAYGMQNTGGFSWDKTQDKFIYVSRSTNFTDLKSFHLYEVDVESNKSWRQLGRYFYRTPNTDISSNGEWMSVWDVGLFDLPGIYDLSSEVFYEMPHYSSCTVLSDGSSYFYIEFGEMTTDESDELYYMESFTAESVHIGSVDTLHCSLTDWSPADEALAYVHNANGEETMTIHEKPHEGGTEFFTPLFNDYHSIEWGPNVGELLVSGCNDWEESPCGDLYVLNKADASAYSISQLTEFGIKEPDDGKK